MSTNLVSKEISGIGFVLKLLEDFLKLHSVLTVVHYFIYYFMTYN